jgi:hypothetical protein
LQAGIGRILQAGNDAKALGIAFVTLKIGSLGRRKRMAIQHPGSTEPLADSILTSMTEGRIADIVGQTGRGDDGAEITRFDMLQTVPGDDFAPDHGAQRTPDATGLKAVRQARPHVIALR